MTRQEKIIRALAGRGFVEVTSKSRKYRTLAHPTSPKFYFVGKNGAVRVGATSSGSVSLTSAYADILVAEGTPKE